jgi:hypothetical protein
MGKTKCIHGKQKPSCRECGGSSFCEHGKEKNKCKKCGGSGICEHSKLRTQCRECSGSSFCVHGKQKYYCRECEGSAFCKHNNRKSRCRECKGNGVCEHGNEKRNCREATCRECSVSSFCVHGKQKPYCIDCGGSALCKSEWCETVGNPKYNGYCVPCCIHIHPEIKMSRNYKTKEKEVVDNIKQNFPDFTWIADKRVQDGCSGRRPDLLLDMGTHIIIIEVDENKHSNYDCSCENKRLMELSQDLQHRPIVFIRFNPDAYKNEEGIIVKSCWKLNKQGVIQIMKTKQKEWEERMTSLKQQIQYWIDNPNEKTVEIIELYY